MNKYLLILALLLFSVLASAYVTGWQYDSTVSAWYAGAAAEKGTPLIVIYTISIIMSMTLIRRTAEKREGYTELFEHKKILLARKAFLLGKARI